MKSSPIVLIDAYALLHRGYHAFPHLSTPEGFPTGALYGFTAMIMRIIEKYDPQDVLVCFDMPEQTFRHIAYDQYKAGRSETDESLKVQLIEAHNLSRAFGFKVYEAPSFEADDLLGTLAHQLKTSHDGQIIIATGDKDALQLIEGEKVVVYTYKKTTKDTILYNEKTVKEDFGYTPAQVPDYKGLAGDSSDNIPGIKGIGEKTALKLLDQFGSIENMYRVLESEGDEQFILIGVKGATLEKIKNGKDDAEFSKVLATIRRDAPVSYEESMSWKDRAHPQEVFSYLGKYYFKSLLTQFKKYFKVEAETLFDEQPVNQDLFKKAQIAMWLIDSSVSNPSILDLQFYTHQQTIDEILIVLEQKLHELELFEVYNEIEIPLIPILAKMKQRGIMIDKKHFENLAIEYEKKIKDLEQQIQCFTPDREINVRSPKQVGELLFDILQLPAKYIKKTAKGDRSTNEKELLKMKDVHPVVALLLEYRFVEKMRSTYIEALPVFADEYNTIHCDLIQTGASTGRFSSANPNLQNIPIKNDSAKIIRKGFVARSGYTFMACDYSQIELRIAAMLSGDADMVTIFKNGEDIHTGVASRVFNKPTKEITADERRKAKVINFGIVYGMGVTALTENLGTTRAEAQLFYDQYKSTFGGLMQFIQETKDFAEKNGYTTTYFGRRCNFKDIHSSIPFVKAMAQRMAANAPIQGTATADLIKLALRFVWEKVVIKYGEDICMPLLQIHDELLFEVKKGHEKEISVAVKEVMEHVFELSYKKKKAQVPILIETHFGDSWDQLK